MVLCWGQLQEFHLYTGCQELELNELIKTQENYSGICSCQSTMKL